MQQADMFPNTQGCAVTERMPRSTVAVCRVLNMSWLLATVLISGLSEWHQLALLIIKVVGMFTSSCRRDDAW